METKTGKFFEVGARFHNMEKKVENVTMCVEAETFGQAEEIALKWLSADNTDVDVRTVRIVPYDTIVTGRDDNPWFVSRYKLLTVDEVSGREKSTPYLMLVQAADLREALTKTTEYLNGHAIVWHDNIAVGVSPVKEMILDGEAYGRTD